MENGFRINWDYQPVEKENTEKTTYDEKKRIFHNIEDDLLDYNEYLTKKDNQNKEKGIALIETIYIDVSTHIAWLCFDLLDCRRIDWYTVNQSVERKIPKESPSKRHSFGIHGISTMVSVTEYTEEYNEEEQVFI